MQEVQTKTWYEDESFWKTFAPTMFNQERLDVTTEEIDHIIKLLNVEKGTKILDLCCGIGRHSLELARRGYSVVGVDLTEEYLAKARKQAESEGLHIEFIRNDMRHFCQIESFDAIINMFTAFGYFEDVSDDKRVLLNVWSSLRKGGKLLIDIIGKEVIAKMFSEREWRKCNDNIFLRESKVCQNWSWCQNKWMMLENGKLKEFSFGHRIYSAVELASLLNDSGFSSVNIYGDLAGAEYDHNAKRLIAVAGK
jgi:cyclopropane fatty-acyl-phospholipid synthase-like methyltransferase